MKHERKGSRKREPRLWLSPRWWLPVSFAVSILVHLLMLPLVSRVLQPSPIRHAQSDGGTVVVQLSPAPISGAERKSTAAPPRKALPPTRETVRPAPRPSVTAPPAKVAEVKTPPITAPPILGTPIPQPTAPPTQRVLLTPPTPIAPTQTTGQFADRVPVPLPKGVLNGQREIEPLPPRLVAAPEATPSPLPPRVADSEGGRAGGGVVPMAPTERVLNSQFVVGSGGGSGGGESPAAGSGQGAGSSDGSGNGLGITRGIPFGDITGLSNGDPNGGGGRGGGPGGAFAARYGGGRFTLRRAAGRGAGPPVHVVYVIDTSGSMEESNKIGKARAALKKALDELRPEDSFNIVEFSDTAKLFSQGMRPATSGNVSAGNLAVDLIQPTGATNLSAALDLALSQPGITHVFVMSDGEPTEGVTDFDKLIEFARDRNAGHARIITLALGLGEKFKGMQLLRDLAEDNGGRFDYINLARN